MSANITLPNRSAMQKPFRLTGLKVLLMTVSFFAVVIGANFLMAYFAISTFSGLQTKRPYESGLAFNRAIADAKAQGERQWSVDVTLDHAKDGSVSVLARLSDAQNLSLAGYHVEANFLSPIDTKRDHTIGLTDLGDGRYQGATTAEAGQWDIEINAVRENTILFHSVSRVILH